MRAILMFNDKHHVLCNLSFTGCFTAVQHLLLPIFIALTLCMPVHNANAQQSQEEHESHHPDLQATSQPNQNDLAITGIPNTPNPAAIQGNGKGSPGGMMPAAVMDQMMEKMGAPKPKDLYPTLMALPDLPQEQRDELKRAAHQRMLQGTSTMSDGFNNLSNATSREDYAGMQEAVEQVKQGLSQYDSGLATHRALEEGKAPKNVAMQWFKSQMNLLPISMQKQLVTFFGMSPFHTSIMVVLILFAVAMIWMYFFKMRRAAALLAELAADQSTNSNTFKAEPSIESAAEEIQKGQVIPHDISEQASPAIVSPVAAGKWSGELKVISIFQETHNVRTFRLAEPGGTSLPFNYLPGQFLTFSLQPEDKVVKRSYTIASSPSQRDFIEVTIKREEHGLISQYMHDQVKTGDRLQLTAPAGKFYFDGTQADNIVLLAGGVGITPMMSVTRYLTAHCWPGNIYFLFCTRTSNDFIFQQELEQLQQRHANLHVLASMTRAEGTSWMGPREQFTAEMIKGFVPDITQHRAHICGPPAMMDAVKDLLSSLSVPATQIKTEAFGTVKRAPANKPPINPVSSDQPVPKVAFSASNKTADLPPGKTILEAADDSGVEIENSCRSGSCGSCKVKLLSGQVSMEIDDALEPDEIEDGYILACQAIANEDVVVEA
jgi:ferredoxin-NADP reductase